MEKDSQDQEFSLQISQAGFNWDEWGGLPYAQFGPRGCWGFVRAVIRASIGVDLPAFDEYQADAKAVKERESFTRLADWNSITVNQAQPFDVIVFTGVPSHVGVMCAPDKFIHVERGEWSRIERQSSRRWRNRIEGVYRFTP